MSEAAGPRAQVSADGAGAVTDQGEPIALVRFTSLNHDDLVHGVSTRHGGLSRHPYNTLNLGMSTADEEPVVAQNRRIFINSAGAGQSMVIYGRLRHGREVAVFDSRKPESWPVIEGPRRAGSGMHERAFHADAVISNASGLTFFMTFADCVPIMLWDPVERALGLIHAGWRGTALRIASVTLQAMRDVFGSRPINIRAAIGPSIGPGCYQVGAEVRAAFDVAYGYQAGQFFQDGALDLWEANSFDLASVGLDPDQIENPRLCTACHTTARGRTFFSHRAEGGITGRLGACMGLRG